MIRSGSSSLASTPSLKTINKKNRMGETLLHRSTIRGDLARTSELLELGADPNVQDHAGWTPLHEACNYGHYEIAQLLLRYGADINASGLDGQTPLHDAVMNTHPDICHLLLKSKADPHRKDDNGRSALDLSEDSEVISALLCKYVTGEGEYVPIDLLSATGFPSSPLINAPTPGPDPSNPSVFGYATPLKRPTKRATPDDHVSTYLSSDPLDQQNDQRFDLQNDQLIDHQIDQGFHPGNPPSTPKRLLLMAAPECASLLTATEPISPGLPKKQEEQEEKNVYLDQQQSPLPLSPQNMDKDGAALLVPVTEESSKKTPVLLTDQGLAQEGFDIAKEKIEIEVTDAIDAQDKLQADHIDTSDELKDHSSPSLESDLPATDHAKLTVMYPYTQEEVDEFVATHADIYDQYKGHAHYDLLVRLTNPKEYFNHLDILQTHVRAARMLLRNTAKTARTDVSCETSWIAARVEKLKVSFPSDVTRVLQDARSMEDPACRRVVEQGMDRLMHERALFLDRYRNDACKLIVFFQAGLQMLLIGEKNSFFNLKDVLFSLHAEISGASLAFEGTNPHAYYFGDSIDTSTRDYAANLQSSMARSKQQLHQLLAVVDQFNREKQCEHDVLGARLAEQWAEICNTPPHTNTSSPFPLAADQLPILKASDILQAMMVAQVSRETMFTKLPLIN